MKALKFLAALFTLAFFLSGCKDSPSTAAPAKTTEPVSIAAIEAEAKGFPVGSTMSVRTVYVFFDPQCPHCAQLWESAKPLKSQAKFVWIPVGLISKTSEAQGATILASKDPVSTMDQHEASILAKTGGISASGDTDALKASVVKNTALMTRFGFASVPTIVAQHAQTGAVVTREGALPTPGLANFLGLQVPGGQ